MNEADLLKRQRELRRAARQHLSDHGGDIHEAYSELEEFMNSNSIHSEEQAKSLLREAYNE